MSLWILTLLFMTFSPTKCLRSYVVTCSEKIIPGIPLDVRVSILTSPSDVTVEARIENANDGSVVVKNATVISKGQTDLISVQVPYNLPQSAYTLSVEASGGLSFRNSSRLIYDNRWPLVYIQTDKTRYSAGQEVKFRVIFIQPNLLGFNGNVSITFYDGKDNSVQEIGPVEPKQGVVKGILPLSNEPVFGDWRITALANDKMTSMKFEVNDYVTPKFSVSIKILSPTWRNVSTVAVSVTARFTFGAAVSGICTLEIYNYSPGDIYRFLIVSMPITEVAHFNIQKADLVDKGVSFYTNVNIRALVTESATALTIASEKSVSFTEPFSPPYQPTQPLSIKIEKTQSTVVPGLSYYTTVHIDGTPGNGSIAVSPVITTAEIRPCNLNNPPTRWLDVRTTTLNTFYINFDKSGYAPLKFRVPLFIEKVNLTLTYGGASTTLLLNAVPRNAPAILRMSTSRPYAEVGETVEMSVESTQYLNGTMLVEVLIGGYVVYVKRHAVFNTHITWFSIPIETSMVPEAIVLVSYITANGELLSDFVIIHTGGSPFRNNVSVIFNKYNVMPREQIEMKITADPNSSVYVLMENKNNRLFGTENDIHFGQLWTDVISRSKDTRNNVNSYQPYGYGKRDISSRNSILKGDSFGDVNDIMIATGSLILTDAFAYDITTLDLLSENWFFPKECVHIIDFTYKPSLIPTPAPGLYLNGAGKFPTFVPIMEPNTTMPVLHLGTIIRSRYPKTWIWDEYVVGPSGELVVNLTAPDTIASWVASVFATNDHSGFGLPDTKYEITVKNNFFLTMDAPKTVVQGEEFLLQLTASNYMNSSQQVFIQVITSEDPKSPKPIATVVHPGGSRTTFLHITPKNVGVMKLTANARVGFFTSIASDAVEMEIVIKPSGVLRVQNKQFMFELSPSRASSTMSVSLSGVHNMVNGTNRTSVKINGNVMVPSIDGLQRIDRLYNLIDMPQGCGEQTMLNFASGIFVTNYLKTIGKLTKKIKTRTTNIMLSGLQREFTFQHRDGSFSAFGDKDAIGSSWLTAFVLKCFRQADGFIHTHNSLISNALTWLLHYQTADGSFYEPGRIIHTQMQTGSSGRVKITAYILTSLLEYQQTPGIHVSTISSVIQRSQVYLETQLATVSDVYTLAIVCYSLAKARSSQKHECLRKILATAVINDDQVHWEAHHLVTKRTVHRRAFTTKAPSADIEATAYNFLTLIELGEASKGLAIVKWLVSQRNAYGGFASTQDTVISLQALSRFSSSQYQPGSNHYVRLNISSGTFQYAYDVNSSNADVIHMKELPHTTDKVTIMATGTGVAIVDVSMSYYMSGSLGSKDISVNSTLTHETLNSITVKPCVSWHGVVDSGMIVLEVEMPTGFVSDVDQLKAQLLIKKHEANGRIVSVYFDGMRVGQSVCVEVMMDRSDPVVKSQACHITVYDYYNPATQAMTIYESKVLKSANICNMCPLCDFCTGTSGVGLVGVGK